MFVNKKEYEGIKRDLRDLKNELFELRLAFVRMNLFAWDADDSIYNYGCTRVENQMKKAILAILDHFDLDINITEPKQNTKFEIVKKIKSK